MTGRVVHFEVPFDDGDRARNFYRQAFGWNVTEMPELEYTGVSTGPVAESGMPAEPDTSAAACSSGPTRHPGVR